MEGKPPIPLNLKLFQEHDFGVNLDGVNGKHKSMVKALHFM